MVSEGAMTNPTYASTPELSIIVVSYNTREMTLECLRSIYAETRTPFELIVVDNASTDGSADAIKAAFPSVILLTETENHGFAPAHDIALEHSTAPWLLLLNPDTVVLDGALDSLLAFAKANPQAGIWGGRTLFPDGSLNPSSCWGRMTLWSLVCQTSGLSSLFRNSMLLNSEAYGGWQRDTEREVDIVTGCLFLIRRSDWDDLGGFDPVFRMYGEEADLCLRARVMGHRPIITPKAEIIHYGGASETVRADKVVRLLRAKMELIRRHFPPHTRSLGTVLLTLWPLSRWLSLNVAGTVLRREDARAKGDIWREVWQRREEWRSGFI
jgi:GT2 family glycosyltransferase